MNQPKSNITKYGYLKKDLHFCYFIAVVPDLLWEEATRFLFSIFLSFSIGCLEGSLSPPNKPQKDVGGVWTLWITRYYNPKSSGRLWKQYPTKGSTTFAIKCLSIPIVVFWFQKAVIWIWVNVYCSEKKRNQSHKQSARDRCHASRN